MRGDNFLTASLRYEFAVAYVRIGSVVGYHGQFASALLKKRVDKGVGNATIIKAPHHYCIALPNVFHRLLRRDDRFNYILLHDEASPSSGVLFRLKPLCLR